MIIQTRDQKISLASEKWCINSLCVFVRTCICFFGKKANVDGSQPSVGNSIAFSSVVILSINCFGLKPISAAWLFVALKSRDSRKTCHIQFTVIFHEKKNTVKATLTVGEAVDQIYSGFSTQIEAAEETQEANKLGELQTSGSCLLQPH